MHATTIIIDETIIMQLLLNYFNKTWTSLTSLVLYPISIMIVTVLSGKAVTVTLLYIFG